MSFYQFQSLVHLSLDRLQNKDGKNSSEFTTQHTVLSSPKPERYNFYLVINVIINILCFFIYI